MQTREGESRRRIWSVKDVINSYGDNILHLNTDSDSPEMSSRTRELHTPSRDIFRFKDTKVPADDAQAPGAESDQDQYETVMRELAHVKKELIALKIDIASVLEQKTSAMRQSEVSHSKISSLLSSARALEKEIDETNEDQVIAELARIEALQEHATIESLREIEAEQFSSALKSAKIKMRDLIDEIDQSKELEAKLSSTTTDVNALQNELKLVKKMTERAEKAKTPLREAVAEELEAAKRELASIKDEGFQFMTSMDIIRNELMHVTQETARLKKSDDKAYSTIQSLNSKTLRAKAKLESAVLGEKKAKSIADSLIITLEKLEDETKTAQEETTLLREETSIIKASISNIESEIENAENKLESSMQELERVKLSEATALESLKALVHDTVQARASASENSSWIRISKFEYEYLIGRANGAEDIADKKVAAAQAWVEALKASEKEMLLKMEIAQRRMRGGKGEDARMGMTRKVRKDGGNATPGRRIKVGKAVASPGGRYVRRSTSLTIKQRQKVMPDITKLFSGRGNEKDL